MSFKINTLTRLITLFLLSLSFIASSLLSLRNMTSKANNLAYLGNGLIASVSDKSNSILIWNAKDLAIINKISISSFAIAASNNSLLISCNSEGSIAFVDYVKNKVTKEFKMSDDQSDVYFLFSPLGHDGFAAVGSSEKVKIVSLINGLVINTFRAESNEITSLSYSGNNKIIIGTIGNGVYIWDFIKDTVAYVDTKDSKIENILYLENGVFAYSSFQRERVELWSLNGDFIQSIGREERGTSSIIYLGDDLIAIGSYYGDLKVWKIKDEKADLLYEIKKSSPIYDMVYLEDIDRLALLYSNDKIEIIDYKATN